MTPSCASLLNVKEINKKHLTILTYGFISQAWRFVLSIIIGEQPSCMASLADMELNINTINLNNPEKTVLIQDVMKSCDCKTFFLNPQFSKSKHEFTETSPLLWFHSCAAPRRPGS